MSKIKDCFSGFCLEELALLITLVCVGGINEFFCSVSAVAIAVILIIRVIKNKAFVFDLNLSSVAFAVISAGSLFTCLYAVDSGLAFLGFIKYLPVVLFALLLMQGKDKISLLVSRLPYIALCMGMVSFALMFVPFLSGYFNVAERMAGFFQYPNTFALFLLVGELVLISKQKISISDTVIALALIALLLFTQSRAVFVLAVLANFVVLFFRKGRKINLILGAVALVLVLCAVVLAVFFRDNDLVSRYLSISFGESTFVGRLLYNMDALKLFASHPFGMGYMGYGCLNQSVQTGVYSLIYVHNDIFQLALDFGAVPCLLFAVAVIRSVFKKGRCLGHRVIIAVFFLHSLFDFDLQFSAMLMVLMLFMDIDSGKELVCRSSRGVLVGVFAVIVAVSAYFSVAFGAGYFKAYELSLSLYPANSQLKLQYMSMQTSLEKQNQLADEILSQNKSMSAVYSVKSRYAYSEGDFEKVIEYKEKAIELSPFNYDEYEEYCYMLAQGAVLYYRAGDSQSAAYCQQRLVKTVDDVEHLTDRLSDLGRSIKDQPKTKLPDDISEYAHSLKSSEKN